MDNIYKITYKIIRSTIIHWDIFVTVKYKLKDSGMRLRITALHNRG